MDVSGNLYNGFQTALSLHNVYLCFIGCLWGSIVGVLPGIGPLAGIALIIPLTYGLKEVFPMAHHEAILYNEPMVSERFNSRFKEESGGKNVKVRGCGKVKLHLMLFFLYPFLRLFQEGQGLYF